MYTVPQICDTLQIIQAYAKSNRPQCPHNKSHYACVYRYCTYIKSPFYPIMLSVSADTLEQRLILHNQFWNVINHQVKSNRWIWNYAMTNALLYMGFIFCLNKRQIAQEGSQNMSLDTCHVSSLLQIPQIGLLYTAALSKTDIYTPLTSITAMTNSIYTMTQYKHATVHTFA